MGPRARMPRLRLGYRGRLVRGGSDRLAGCRQFRWPRCRGVICRFLSGRRSRFFTRKTKEYVRSPAGWVVRRPRSRGSSDLTRRLAVTPWRTGRRPRSGTRSGAPAARRSRSSPPTTRCVSTSRTGSPASSPDRTAGSCRALTRVGLAAATAADKTGGGREHGVRSRSRTGSGSTSPMMTRCGSRTRRSTRRSTCRDEEPSKASSSRACEPGGRSASPRHAHEGAARSSSPPRS